MAKPPDDDKIGYRSPPKGSRFSKGQSGNRAGRPRGSKNKRAHDWADRFADLIIEEADRTVALTEDGQKITMSMVKAIVRSTAVNAAKGSAKAQKLFLEVLHQASRYKDERHSSVLETVVAFKHNWYAEFAEHIARGEPVPDVMPHPDHIHIDPETSEITMTGPLTREQRDLENQQHVQDHKKEVKFLETLLDEVDDDVRPTLLKHIEEAKEILALYEKIAKKQHRYAQPEDKA
jgi:hypothetical protein